MRQILEPGKGRINAPWEPRDSSEKVRRTRNIDLTLILAAFFLTVNCKSVVGTLRDFSAFTTFRFYHLISANQIPRKRSGECPVGEVGWKTASVRAATGTEKESAQILI